MMVAVTVSVLDVALVGPHESSQMTASLNNWSSVVPRCPLSSHYVWGPGHSLTKSSSESRALDELPSSALLVVGKDRDKNQLLPVSVIK